MRKHSLSLSALALFVTIFLTGCQAGNPAPEDSDQNNTGVNAPQESGSGGQEKQPESGSGSY
ncbi:MAG: hypothetical protein ABIK07_21685 [Planctomycetota bacterium]